MQFEQDRKKFLESFPGIKTFQTFDDVKERKSRKLIYQCSTDADQYPIDGDIDFRTRAIPVKIIRDLEARNEYRACISLTINETNGKGRTKKNIKKIRAVWADFDEAPLPKTWDEKPSIVIETSPCRFHCYWLAVIDDKHYEIPIDAFKPIQEGIAEKFGSDPSVADITKAMRIPGFNHQKKEPFMVRIIEYSGVRFDFGHLVSLFPPRKREAWSAEKYRKYVNNSDETEFKGAYGTSEGGRNHFICKRVGGCIKRGLSWPEIEQEAYKEAAACSPPLPEYEVKAILKSMQRY